MGKQLVKHRGGHNHNGAQPLPPISVAMVEKDVGFLLALNFQPSTKVERNLVLAFEAARRQVERKTRQPATLDAILKSGYFRRRLRELLADKMFQEAKRVNFPLHSGDPRAKLFEDLIKRAHEALPPALKVKIPALTVRFAGLAPGEKQAHYPALVPPPAQKDGK